MKDVLAGQEYSVRVRVLTVTHDTVSGKTIVEFAMLGDIHYATAEDFRRACTSFGGRLEK